ncbi:MAG: nicotinate-nucleotide--dimethylbenzimidazole phosphoribosyltransferase [Pseudomonadota bacterium]|nr:nicotinate-nucleotide--dimethylbenzimidazole phosphoribosyltransferase [Pseudomonadota bacterium]
MLSRAFIPQFTWWQHPIAALNLPCQAAAVARQAVLTKPAGALGQLETLATQLAAMQGRAQPSLTRPWISVFAADHGITQSGVSAYPSEVTAQMVVNFVHGGAAINVLAQQIRAKFEIIDVGVASDTTALPTVIQAKTVCGTANFQHTPAMTLAQCEIALQAGHAAVQRAIAAQTDCWIGGEMGIGNTSSATAIASCLLAQPAVQLTGAGTGLTASAIQHKAQVIQHAIDQHALPSDDPVQVLCGLGGFEIAALCGSYLAAAQAGLPILVDGFISSVAALVATRIQPACRDWMIFAHQSAEQGHQSILHALHAQPILTLDMRLGEGSGAATAFHLLQLACSLHNQMATFAEAQVSQQTHQA